MRKGIWIGLAILLLASVIGLAVTGQMIGWGPFAFLHSWEKEVVEIETRYSKERKGEIIFYGASNFSLWDKMEEDFNQYKVQNHAFGGSTDNDLVKYQTRLIDPYEPSIIIFQTGSNDYVHVKGSDDEKIAQVIEYKEVMFKKIHERHPETKIIVMSGLLLPGRSEYLNITLKVNDEIEALSQKYDYITFVNTNDLTYDGTSMDSSLFVKDGIHLNRDGQLRWMNEYIQPAIEQIIQEYGLESLYQ